MRSTSNGPQRLRLRQRAASAALAAAVTVLAGCQSPRVADDLIPPMDDRLSMFGAGRGRLDFGALPVVRFEAGFLEPLTGEVDRLVAAMAELGDRRRVLLVGVGDETEPMEHGRQQAVARAVAVRRVLVRRGVSPSLVWVTGVAAAEAELVAVGDEGGPRVEVAVVR